MKNTSYGRLAFQRRRKDTLGEEETLEFYIASAEDIVLNKLSWFQMGGQVSERQWQDILGVLKVQAGLLDMQYLLSWAKKLKLMELLDKAIREARI